MTKKKITTLTLSAVLAGTAGVPATSEAKYSTKIGIGDQQAAMFEHSAFQATKIKRARYFIPWNAMDHAGRRLDARNYVLTARRHGVKVFMHISTDDLRRKKAKLPSTSAYRSKVGRLVRYFKRLGVREWGVWNEANHDSQPTYRSPSRAASYFKTMRRLCRGCTILALDVLDQAGVERYMRRWYKALGSYRRYATRVGIHNYSDINRKRTRGTRSIIRTAKRYKRSTSFWLTETGGVVNFGGAFPYNEARAANRLRYLFTVTTRYRRDIDRVYVYNWTGAPAGARFDAGVTNSDGSLRAGYTELRRGLRRFSR